MRLPHLLVILGLALVANSAFAQAFTYTAHTASPVPHNGAVTAGVLTWTCNGSDCTIHGPWLAPGVPACAALAAQVGRIASYGRPGAMLNATQLAQCNANVPTATLRVDPSLIRPNQPTPLPRPMHIIPTAPAPIPTAPTQVAIEPGARPEDNRVFALSGSTIEFHGRTAALPAPPLPVPAHIDHNRLVVPALTLQASAHGDEPTARSSHETPPFYHFGATGDVVISVPVRMSDLPTDMLGLYLDCSLSRGRYVPSPVESSPYVALWSPESGGEGAEVAIGTADVYIASHIDRWETTIDVPLQLRPFQRLEDARSYDCAIKASVDRVSPPGRELLDIASLVLPTSSSSRAPYHPAPGTTPQLYVRGNLQ